MLLEKIEHVIFSARPCADAWRAAWRGAPVDAPCQTALCSYAAD